MQGPEGREAATARPELGETDMVALRGIGRDRYSLLIADHEDTLRRELDSVFRAEGYETHLAADDIEAVEIVHRERIDVVILEIELPHAGGLDAFRAIRGRVGTVVPCVFTALEVSGRVQLEAMSVDAFTVVPKPVDDSMMKRIVRSVIRHYYPGTFEPEMG